MKETVLRRLMNKFYLTIYPEQLKKASLVCWSLRAERRRVHGDDIGEGKISYPV